MGERNYKKKAATMELTTENGWFLTPEGLGMCNNSFEEAINMDLSEIGAQSLPEELGRGKVDVIKAGIILQVSKIRNVSAPKSHEDSKAAPRMLKITLTDGKKSCNAIEMSKLDGISLEKTMPGVKVKLVKDVPVSSGYLLLESGSLTVIGGHVEVLAKKWQMKTEVWTREQDGVEGLPPAWIPFGSKIPGAEVVERNFKALPNQSSISNNKENSEFDSLRNDAIKEASKTGNQKVFGAGSKDIKEAEKPTRARDRQKIENGNPKAEVVNGGERERGKGGRKGKGRNREDDTGLTQTKPSGNVSLFAFLEEKLPVEQDTGKKLSSAGAYNDWNPTPRRTGRPSSEKQDRSDISFNEKQRRGDQLLDRDGTSHRGRGRGGRTGNTDGRYDYKTEKNPRDYGSPDLDHGPQYKRGNSSFDSRVGRGGDRGRGSRSGKGGSRDDFSNHSEGLKSNGMKHSDDNFRHPQRGGRSVRPEREQLDRGSGQPERLNESSHERHEQAKYSDRGNRHGRTERGSHANRGNHSERGGQSSRDSKANNAERVKFGNRAQYPDLCTNIDKQSEVSQLTDKSEAERGFSSGNVEKNGLVDKAKLIGAEGGRRKERQGPESRSTGQTRPMNDRDFGEWNNSTYHNSQQTRAPQNYQQQSQFQQVQQQSYQGQQQPQSNVLMQHLHQNNHFQHQIQQHLQAALQSLVITDKGVSNQHKTSDGSRGQIDGGSQQTPDFSQPPPFKNDANNPAAQWPSNQINTTAHPHYVRGGARGGGNSQGRGQWKQQMQPQTGQGLQTSNQQPNFHLSSNIIIQQQLPQAHSAHPSAGVPHQAPKYSVHKQPQAQVLSNNQQPHQWKNGDQGMAKYWEDGKYYPIEVSAISTTTAVVLFKDYGNFEEVLLQDLLPMPMSLSIVQSLPVGQPMRFIPATPGLPPAFPHQH